MHKDVRAFRLVVGRKPCGHVAGGQDFSAVWLLVALANMWVGVHHAGYTVRGELPILFVVFLVPALIAAVAAWRLVRADSRMDASASPYPVAGLRHRDSYHARVSF